MDSREIFPYNENTAQFEYAGQDPAMTNLYTKYLKGKMPDPFKKTQEESFLDYEIRIRDFAITKLRNRGFFTVLFGINSVSSRNARFALQKEMCGIFYRTVESTLFTEPQIKAMYNKLNEKLEAERGFFGGMSDEITQLKSDLITKQRQAIKEHRELKKSEVEKIEDRINEANENPAILNDWLSRECIDIPLQSLRENVSGLNTPGKPNTPAVTDLLKKIEDLNTLNKTLPAQMTVLEQHRASKAKAATVSPAPVDPSTFTLFTKKSSPEDALNADMIKQTNRNPPNRSK